MYVFFVRERDPCYFVLFITSLQPQMFSKDNGQNN